MMANQQGGSIGGQHGTQGSSPDQATGRQTPSTGQTGVRDATYNLISVVYHALQGAETYKMYEEDVERTEDAELAQFFRQAHEEEKRRAQRGKELLQRHLQRHQGGGGQQLQGGTSGQQGGAGQRGQQSQSGSSRQQSQSGSGSGQMGASSSGSGQHSQSGSSSTSGSRQSLQQGSGSSGQFGSSPRSRSSDSER